jgi:flagellar biosynthesis protein FliQ
MSILLGVLIGSMVGFQAADKIHEDALDYGYSRSTALVAAMTVYALIIAWIATLFWAFVETIKYIF